MGIENLKKVLHFIFILINSGFTIDSNADGKVSFAEILSKITTLAFKFPEVYEAFPFLKREFKDLNAKEREELMQFVLELDLPAKYDNIEELIKITVNALAYNYNFVLKVKELLKKDTDQ